MQRISTNNFDVEGLKKKKIPQKYFASYNFVYKRLWIERGNETVMNEITRFFILRDLCITRHYLIGRYIL